MTEDPEEVSGLKKQVADLTSLLKKAQENVNVMHNQFEDLTTSSLVAKKVCAKRIAELENQLTKDPEEVSGLKKQVANLTSQH